MHELYELHFRSKERKEIWLQLISEWKISDISQTSFCKVRGVKLSDFKRWLYRLGKNEKADDSVILPHKQMATPQFIPLEIQPSVPTQIMKSYSFKLIHASGWSLEIPADFEESTFSRVMNLLLRKSSC
jgi:hypothetical protein